MAVGPGRGESSLLNGLRLAELEENLVRPGCWCEQLIQSKEVPRCFQWNSSTADGDHFSISPG